MRSLDGIAPAGAINSSAADMAKWVRFQLGGGVFEGNRLLSEAAHEETWTTQIEIEGKVSYGMGWIIRDWKGQKMLEHGGNVEGFAAQVGLLPESNLGYVLLTNVTVSPLQGISQGLVWEALAGEGLSRETGGVDTAPYLGTYMATIREDRLTIKEENGRLALEIEGKGTFELKPPDEEGVWRFALTDQVGVSFPDDGSGAVNTMIIHEGPTTVECFRQGYVPPPEIDLAELERHLGTYKSWDSDAVLRLIVRNNRLAIDWTAKGLILELHSPDEEGLWAFRLGDGSAARFGEEGGVVKTLTIVKDGKVQDQLERTEAVAKAATVEDLPTVEEILALRLPPRRRAALRKLDHYRLRGTFRLVHSGVSGRTDIFVGGLDRIRTDIDLGEFGHIRFAISGDQGWSDNSMTEFEELEGVYLAQAKQGNPTLIFGDWREFFDTVEVVRATEYRGRKVWILKMRGGDLPPWTAYVDAKTGDTLREVRASILPRGMGTIEMAVRYEDFRRVNGLRVPFRHIMSHEAMGTVITELTNMDARTPIPDKRFVLRPEDEAVAGEEGAQEPVRQDIGDPKAGLRRR